MYDGWVKIGTKLDTKGMEKDLAKLKSELSKLEREEVKLKVKLDKSQSGLSEYQKEIEALKQSTDQELSLTTSDEQAKNVLAVEEQTLALINDKYEKQLSTVSQIKTALEENQGKQQELTQSIEATNNSLNKAKGLSNVYEQVGSSASNIKDKMNSVIKKVTRWGLALFGIRSMYLGIQRLMSSLSQYNDQIKTDLEYMRFSIAVGFENVIKSIIQGVFTIMQYINYIAMAWFGVNLFAKATADNFEKSRKGLAGAKKEAKELQKTLTGFDEMNVLNDSGGTSPGGGVGALAPSVDLSQIDIPIPKWLQWIADNKDKILGFFKVLGGLIVALKLGELLKTLGLFGDLPFWKLVGGIGLILFGIVELVKGIVDFIKDPSWDNFLTILRGIALIVSGIAVLMGGWIVALIALGVAIVTYLIQNWEKVKDILSIVGNWIYDKVIKPVGDFFIGLWNKIKEPLKPLIEFFKATFKTVFENIKITVDNIKQIFSFLWEGIKKIFAPVGEFFKNAFTDAWTKIKSVFSPVATFFGNIFNTIKGIFKSIGQTIGNVIGSAFKTAINAVLSIVDNVINVPIRAINKLTDVINKVPGLNLKKLNVISIPRLATGGIINNPGRGVPLGRAIGGEAGSEGVIPLTDSQAMETLGQAIGRYITLNLTNVNQMNGRVISREIKKITANDEFALNY